MCKLFGLAVLLLKIFLRKTITSTKINCVSVHCSIVDHAKNLGALEAFSMQDQLIKPQYIHAVNYITMKNSVLYTHFHSSIIHNNEKVETAQVSIDG